MAVDFDGIVTAEGAAPDFPEYSSRMHEYLMESVREGDAINNNDPGLSKLDETIDYIQGQQLLGLVRGVGAVGIDLQQHVGKGASRRTHDLDIVPRLDL